MINLIGDEDGRGYCREQSYIADGWVAQNGGDVLRMHADVDVNRGKSGFEGEKVDNLN